MSEYHDTNEDERAWCVDYQHRRQVGAEIADCATTPRLEKILRRVVESAGDQKMLEAFDKRINERVPNA